MISANDAIALLKSKQIERQQKLRDLFTSTLEVIDQDETEVL